VASLGQVTLAAQHLGISQPAASAHIQTLERRYGRRLFDRNPRGLQLTELGEAVLEQAHRIFLDLAELDAVSETEEAGEVALAASTTPGAYHLPQLLMRFQEQHPDLFPQLSIGDSRYVLDAVESLRVSLGIVGELPTGHNNKLVRQLWATDRLRLMAAASHPLARARHLKLGEHTLIVRELGSSTRAYAEALLLDHLGAFGRVLELTSPEAVKEAVVAGLGVAVLSSWACRREEQAGLLRPVRARSLTRQRPFYLIRRRQPALGRRARILWEFLGSPGA
jgi:DNA-binding transcriptional LysR family regulator